MTDHLYPKKIEPIEGRIRYTYNEYPDDVQTFYFTLINLWDELEPNIVDLSRMARNATYHSKEELENLPEKLYCEFGIPYRNF